MLNPPLADHIEATPASSLMMLCIPRSEPSGAMATGSQRSKYEVILRGGRVMQTAGVGGGLAHHLIDRLAIRQGAPSDARPKDEWHA
jgi:hypothetical protein